MLMMAGMTVPAETMVRFAGNAPRLTMATQSATAPMLNQNPMV